MITPFRFIVGAVQVLIGLMLGWMALSAILVLTRSDDEPMTEAGPFVLAGLIALTLVTCVACLMNGGRLIAPQRFSPMRWRRLPLISSILLGVTLLLWFTGFSS